jgi:hypothetical protein
MRFDESVKRFQRRGAGANQIGQRRDAQVDTLAGVTFTLPVKRRLVWPRSDKHRGSADRISQTKSSPEGWDRQSRGVLHGMALEVLRCLSDRSQ